MDFALRGRALLVYPPLEVLNYTGSTLASAGVWGGALWLASRLFLPRDGWKRRAAHLAAWAFFALVVLPLAVFSFPGQALYARVFGAYMARDTVRVGIALRGTLGDWLLAWGGPWVFVVMVLAGMPLAGLFAWLTRKVAPSLAPAVPALPVLGFGIAFTCFWTDFVESRSLQAAPPDTCFIHGVVHALRDAVTGVGWVRHGFTLRTPAPLPRLTRPEHAPNVLLILTESVRADAMCSAPKSCRDPWLDGVVPDRIPLGSLVTQSPGTFSACMMLWTGLPPTVDLATAHQAPVLWEIARATGRRTAYVTSQNLRYDDFGAFVERAGIDVLISAIDLGSTKNAQLGAPDELASARMLDFVRDTDAPYFAVLHFSNTHSPDRTDPALLPFVPESTDPTGPTELFHAHYLNSVALQERTLAAFLTEVRKLPSWNDTVVVFLSDHGEDFREHGRLYHIKTLFDEEVRVPGWIAAGPRALEDGQLRALRALGMRRTYSEDVNATIVDLLGVEAEHPQLPFAALTTGRSLLRAPLPPFMALLSTETAVWLPDEPQYGVMDDGHLLAASAVSPWQCYNLLADPGEVHPQPAASCGGLLATGTRAFPQVARPR